MKASDFYTRTRANTGVEIQIPLPNGKASAEKLTILSLESDAFQLAKSEKFRRNIELAAIEPGPERDKLELEAENRLLSALVTGWSFEDEFSREAVEKLFAESPYLATFVDKAASNKTIFFG